jgi:arginine/lysine/ornithine decarboxylase
MFSIMTTTSPNSLLLASLDATQSWLTKHGKTAISKTAVAVKRLKSLLVQTFDGESVNDDLVTTLLKP